MAATTSPTGLTRSYIPRTMVASSATEPSRRGHDTSRPGGPAKARPPREVERHAPTHLGASHADRRVPARAGPRPTRKLLRLRLRLRRDSADAREGNVGSDGSTPLHQAVRQNDLKTVDTLIKSGVRNVKAATRGMASRRAHVAATNGNAAILRRLLSAGADANTATPGGEDGAHDRGAHGEHRSRHAAPRPRRQRATRRTRSARRPRSMWAVTENHPDVVKLLVARGADVKAQTDDHDAEGRARAARAPAAPPGRASSVSARLPTKDGGMTPLLFAVRDGNVADDAAAAGARRRHQSGARAIAPRRCSSPC